MHTSPQDHASLILLHSALAGVECKLKLKHSSNLVTNISGAKLLENAITV